MLKKCTCMGAILKWFIGLGNGSIDKVFDPQFSGGIKLFRCNLKLSFILSDAKHIFKTLVLVKLWDHNFHELMSSTFFLVVWLEPQRYRHTTEYCERPVAALAARLYSQKRDLHVVSPTTHSGASGTILAQHRQSCPWSMHKTFVLYIMSTCILF